MQKQELGARNQKWKSKICRSRIFKLKKLILRSLLSFSENCKISAAIILDFQFFSIRYITSIMSAWVSIGYFLFSRKNNYMRIRYLLWHYALTCLATALFVVGIMTEASHAQASSVTNCDITASRRGWSRESPRYS